MKKRLTWHEDLSQRAWSPRLLCYRLHMCTQHSKVKVPGLLTSLFKIIKGQVKAATSVVAQSGKGSRTKSQARLLAHQVLSESLCTFALYFCTRLLLWKSKWWEYTTVRHEQSWHKYQPTAPATQDREESPGLSTRRSPESWVVLNAWAYHNGSVDNEASSCQGDINVSHFHCKLWTQCWVTDSWIQMYIH